MTTAGTWYPPTFLSNPPFAPMTQDLTVTLQKLSKRFAPMTQDITETLQERGQRYGKFTGHARITQDLKAVIAGHTPRGEQLPDGTTGDFLAADQQEALDMICHKIGRIINGEPDCADSWHDIASYARLVADRLSGVD